MGRTVAENAMACGTGALNIDATRIEYLNQEDADAAVVPMANFGRGRDGDLPSYRHIGRRGDMFDPSKGRWPANVILDAIAEVLVAFPQSEVSGAAKQGHVENPSVVPYHGMFWRSAGMLHGDSGTAARFFKQVKV